MKYFWIIALIIFALAARHVEAHPHTVCWDPYQPDSSLTPDYFIVELTVDANKEWGYFVQTTVYKEWEEQPPEGWNQIWYSPRITETYPRRDILKECPQPDA